MEEAARLTPGHAEFLVVSFEGPEKYSTVGSLGTRVAQLAYTLARKGFHTQLILVGDPRLPRREYRIGWRLFLHHWSQWVSRCYPDGVYHGKEAELHDLNETLPSLPWRRSPASGNPWHQPDHQDSLRENTGYLQRGLSRANFQTGSRKRL